MLQVSNALPTWIEQIKWLVSMGGGFWAVFKVVKDALTNTQEGVVGIKTELTAQTQAIVKATDTQTSELKELRTDVGRLVQAMMVVPAPSARAARAARRKR
jgi:hypothetical protein